MNIEKAGDKVFANADQALAEKIISRSKENGKETEPAAGLRASPEAGDDDGNDDPLEFYMADRHISLLKIAAAVVLMIMLLKMLFGGGGKGQRK